MPNFELLIIMGCGGHARSVANAALLNGAKAILFIDEKANKGEKLFGFHVEKRLPSSLPKNHAYIIAYGNNLVRKRIIQHIIRAGLNVINIISNLSVISPVSNINLGTFIGPYSYVGPLAKIGLGCIINTAAIIEHDCIIGNYSHVSINATLCGKVAIGENCFIGAGSTIIDNITICADVCIGAGAVVTKNITTPGTYAGVPARLINQI